jgi:uncharacterized FlgJ-related protein
MLKNIKDLSDLIKIENIENNSDNFLPTILKIIEEETGLVLKEKDMFIKKNILKIKSSSNTRFIILLYLKNINKKIKDSNQNFILEL